VALLSVVLDRSSAEPMVRQLYLRVRELIMAGRLAAGARLPSTRKLARDLQVSRTVTLDAFAQLAAEGFIEGRHGSGHFVASLPIGGVGGVGSAPARPADDEGVSIWSEVGVPFDPAWQDVPASRNSGKPPPTPDSRPPKGRRYVLCTWSRRFTSAWYSSTAIRPA